jgi:hypothetical protein
VKCCIKNKYTEIYCLFHTRMLIAKRIDYDHNLYSMQCQVIGHPLLFHCYHEIYQASVPLISKNLTLSFFVSGEISLTTQKCSWVWENSIYSWVRKIPVRNSLSVGGSQAQFFCCWGIEILVNYLLIQKGIVRWSLLYILNESFFWKKKKFKEICMFHTDAKECTFVEISRSL